MYTLGLCIYSRSVFVFAKPNELQEQNKFPNARSLHLPYWGVSLGPYVIYQNYEITQPPSGSPASLHSGVTLVDAGMGSWLIRAADRANSQLG